MKEIYLAGGCFWGVEAYFKKLKGISFTAVGYANSEVKDPSYEEVCSLLTGASEAVQIKFDSKQISLQEVLAHFFRIIDPCSLNRQGGDQGTQYRTGIYYLEPSLFPEIIDFIDSIRRNYARGIVVEVLPLQNFYLAESYHQDYLTKTPRGYCHVNLALASQELSPAELGQFPEQEDLRSRLTELEYAVTQLNFTEPPFQNKYNNHYAKGVYVDVVSGEVLFLSKDKYNSSCGWPSFTKPAQASLTYHADNQLARARTEVRSKEADSHLGHVFDDGPRDRGGKRYCINSAALKFIPYEQLEEAGLASWKEELDQD